MPATNPKSYYLKYGIIEQHPTVLESGKSGVSKPIIAAKIVVEKNYSNGILGIVAFNSVEGGTLGRMVIYFSIPESDSEDNVLRVSIVIS